MTGTFLPLRLQWNAIINKTGHWDLKERGRKKIIQKVATKPTRIEEKWTFGGTKIKSYR